MFAEGIEDLHAMLDKITILEDSRGDHAFGSEVAK